MEDNNGSGARYLIVNRAEIVSQGCNACGQGFGSEPPGARALSVTMGPGNGTYLFCGGCGDAIMEHLHIDTVRQRYCWDWTVPLRGRPLRNLDGN